MIGTPAIINILFNCNPYRNQYRRSWLFPLNQALTNTQAENQQAIGNKRKSRSGLYYQEQCAKCFFNCSFRQGKHSSMSVNVGAGDHHLIILSSLRRLPLVNERSRMFKRISTTSLMHDKLEFFQPIVKIPQMLIKLWGPVLPNLPYKTLIHCDA